MVTQFQLRRQQRSLASEQLSLSRRAATPSVTATTISPAAPATTPTSTGKPASQYSSDELRQLGRGISIKEGALSAIAQKIGNVESKRAERSREGKADAATYRQKQLDGLKEQYAREYAELESLREQLAPGVFDAARANAPKNYRTDLINRKNDPPPPPVPSIYDPGRTVRQEIKDSSGKVVQIKTTILPANYRSRIARVSEGNKEYQGQVVGSQFIGVRSVTQQERLERATAQEQQRYRQSPGVIRSTGGQVPRGTAILVSESGARPQNARELFTALDAPTRRDIAAIEFGREARQPVGVRGLRLIGIDVPRGEEVSRRTTIQETSFLVPNEASARFAGFETEGVSFPATYTGLRQIDQDFARPTFLEVNSPKTAQKAKQLTATLESFDVYAKEGAARPNIVSVKGNVGLFALGVQKAGAGVGFIGEKVKAAAPFLTPRERTPFVTREQQQANRLLRPIASVRGSIGLLGQEVRARAGVVGPSVFESGSILTSISERMKERPLTLGLGEAVLYGTPFGLAKEVSTAFKTAGTVRRGSQLVARAGKAAKAQRVAGRAILGAEIAGGAVLGTTFIVDTAAQLNAASQPGDLGRVLADTGANVLGFGVGARVASRGVRAGLTGVRAADRAVFVRTTAPGWVIRRSLRPEVANQLQAAQATTAGVTIDQLTGMGRRGEVGGRSARQRSGRISQAQLRERKPSPNAPKFLVTKTDASVTAALRGKARKRTQELRLLELEVSRKDFQRDRFITSLKTEPGVSVQVNAPQLIKADVALPGTRSPNIPPPQGRVRVGSAQSQIRMSQETMNQLIAERRQEGLANFLSRQQRRGVVGRVNQLARPVALSPKEPFVGGEQNVITKQRGRTTSELVTTSQPITKKKRRVLESEYAGKLYREPEFIETTAPQEFAAQRHVESGFFARGSAQDRRARALDQLRESMLRRREAVKVQLPAVSGPREVTVVGPRVRELRTPGENALLVIGTGAGQSGRSTPAFITSPMSGVKTRVSAMPRFNQGRLNETNTISSVRSAQDQGSAQRAATSLRFNQLTVQETRRSGGSSGSRRIPSITTSTPPGRGAPTPPTPPPPLGPRPPREPVRPRTPKPPETRIPIPLGGSPDYSYRGMTKDQLVAGFRALIKEKGRFRQLGSGLTKEEAITIGSQAALGSLSATFRIEETGQLVKSKPVKEPRGVEEYFRQYKVKKGKRFITPGTFIQRRGKRLVTRAERSQIQRARLASLGVKNRWL